MKLNSLQMVGLILILSALGGQFLFPGTVVTYSTGTPGIFCWPGMTLPNSPFYIQPNSTINATINLVHIDPGEISSISVQLSYWTGSAWSTVGNYPLSHVGLTLYQTSFPVGNPGTLYALSYLVQTTDVGSFTDLEYVKVETLSGYFAINGIQVTTTSTLTVSNPVLSITYTITGSGLTQSQITAYVLLFNGTTQLQKVTLTPSTSNSAQFTGAITLPAPGTYTLNGYVTFAGSTTLQMSILAPWGNTNSILQIMSLSTIYWTMGIFGVIFLALGSRQKKEKSK